MSTLDDWRRLPDVFRPLHGMAHCLKGPPTFGKCSPATARDLPRRQGKENRGRSMRPAGHSTNGTPIRRPNSVSGFVPSSAGCRASGCAARRGWSQAINSRVGMIGRPMTGGRRPRSRPRAPPVAFITASPAPGDHHRQERLLLPQPSEPKAAGPHRLHARPEPATPRRHPEITSGNRTATRSRLTSKSNPAMFRVASLCRSRTARCIA